MTTTTTLPALTDTDVTVTVDSAGRDVIVIPDAVALELRRQIRTGWREIPDVGDGYSRIFKAGTWVYATTATLLRVYGASPAVPDARWPGDRQWAAADRCMYAMVVGVSGWDADAKWWRGLPETGELHVPANPHRHEYSDGYQYRG